MDLTLEVMGGYGALRRRLKNQASAVSATAVQKVPATAEQAQSSQKQYVIDLFSGGESWRESVESTGLIYIPVDIKTLVAD